MIATRIKTEDFEGRCIANSSLPTPRAPPVNSPNFTSVGTQRALNNKTQQPGTMSRGMPSRFAINFAN
jgi:hypothetical protein